ncbi:MAG: hypothetical protein B7Z65_08940 [Ferrovum sp. 21-44-67]|uniref:LysR family transcriptional regulator n=1 Tax=Ferrovum sp. JA12 TaxID=1356299 RepID=UPI0007150B58|nr:LysR family transcriptional regulator [Ferrovum sp. JA12]KRH78965.1 HTH-type transcriptional regulator CysL [Ferrovum sp. JA12]OYV78769.1 MAG: hypothetical protein B7Z65_08940 [Ferrovum sp. 21-44-67]HQU07106.1 LysR family transcriptional regulator [Ferrovaceae bacterium]
MRLPFQALRAFVEVVEAGSFTRAANNLFISQPAISKSIRELEALFEVKLMDRSHSPVILTDAGNALFTLSKNIFNIEKVIIQDLSQRSQSRLGSLSIGASTTIASHWLSHYLVEFSRRYPAVSISVLSGNSQHIAKLLKNGEIDVGVIEGPIPNEPEIQIINWRKERLVLVAAPHFLEGNTMTNLSALKWIMREEGSGTARVTQEYLTKLAIQPVSIIRVANNLAVLELVRAGLGLALLPEIMIKEKVMHKELVVIPETLIGMEPFIERELNWITLTWRHETPLRKSFKEVLFNFPLA